LLHSTPTATPPTLDGLRRALRFADRFRREDQTFPAVQMAALLHIAIHEEVSERDLAERLGLGLESLRAALAALGEVDEDGRAGHGFVRASGDSEAGPAPLYSLTDRGERFLTTLVRG
jgi:DNA-binding MarR family transcriptional regulator